MPFIALEKNTNKRIDITQVKNPRLTLKNQDCICQLCGEPLIVRSEFMRSGYLVQAHFYHYQGACKSKYEVHPESPEHLRCKELVAQALRAQFAEFSDATIEFEVVVPEANRVADILITFPMGWRVAHEIQLSPISPDKLEERTNAYNSTGIDVYWWLGKSADNAANRAWCTERYGYSLSIDITRSEAQYYSVVSFKDDHSSSSQSQPSDVG